MNIATIQKRKFLNNIYKLFYSTGKKPSDHEIKRAFNQYFSVNKFGEPVRIDLSELQGKDVTDPILINELMTNTLLNLEVLFDCVMENNQESFSVINALNNKIDNLRAKRKEIESRIDQLIYANANSDGFFYSYLENFATTNAIDMDKTTAFVDIVNNQVTIPKITSIASSNVTSQSIITSSIKKTVTYNGRIAEAQSEIVDFDVMFDGLNDTYWLYHYEAPSPGVVSITLEIPITSGFSISKIQGSIISSSPCSVFMKAVSGNTSTGDIVRTQDSKGDYNRFSFTIPNDIYKAIYLTLYKSEPDRLTQNSTAPYEYAFGVRELTIGADYFDERAQLVSSPISIPVSDNSLLAISAVSIDVKQQTVPGTQLSYYVARDVPNSSTISDFDWIPIEPSNFETNSQSSTVNLMNTSFVTEYIDVATENVNVIIDYPIIPLNSTASNANEVNPMLLPFSDRLVYRVASVKDDRKYSQPILISNINCFKSYWISGDNSRVTTNLSQSLQGWADIINDSSYYDLRVNTLNNFTSILNSAFTGPSSELIETKILCEEQRTVSHTLVKSGGAFDLSIYFNGSLIADIPAGQTTTKVEWNFVKGVNTLTIAYDNGTSEKVFIDLMVGANLSDYGTVFLDYYSYLDPLEFRRKVDSSLNVFTIDTVYGSKQILASKEIARKSILKYFSDRVEEISAVRYRVDFNRYNNPLQTPVLDGIRIKFKHTDV